MHTFLVLLLLFSKANTKNRSNQQLTVSLSDESHELQHDGKCSLWFNYNSTSMRCECIDDDNGGVVLCDTNKQTVYVLNCFCMTHQQEEIVLSACFFNCAINQGKVNLTA